MINWIYEIERQIDAKENGTYDTEIEQETRRWDEESGTTIRMRSKADAIDYKYFVEPNIPPFKITEELINEVKELIPVLPNEKKLRYINKLGLTPVEANILIKDKDLSVAYIPEFPELFNNKNDTIINEAYHSNNIQFKIYSKSEIDSIIIQ